MGDGLAISSVFLVGTNSNAFPAGMEQGEVAQSSDSLHSLCVIANIH